MKIKSGSSWAPLSYYCCIHQRVATPEFDNLPLVAKQVAINSAGACRICCNIFVLNLALSVPRLLRTNAHCIENAPTEFKKPIELQKLQGLW